MTKELWKEFGNSLIHPLDTFEEIRYKKTGSVGIASLFIFLLFFVTSAERQLLAFRFNKFSPENTNPLLIFVSSTLLIIIAVAVNWGISTLWDGKANFRTIWIVLGYSLCPYIASTVVRMLVSHFMIVDEITLLNFISTAGLIWTGLLIWFGLLQAQEYTIGKNALCLIVTAIGIVLVIALGFLVIMLFSQMFSFFGTLVEELTLRFK